MDHLLNLAVAARLAGVSRRVIQSKIRAGELIAFEGQVRMSELIKIYPDIGDKTDVILERLNRIQDSALYSSNTISDERLLAHQVHRLQLKLSDAYAQLQAYEMLAVELQQRLLALQEGCEREQRQMIQALLRWLAAQLEKKP